jgi:hypothetical protein
MNTLPGRSRWLQESHASIRLRERQLSLAHSGEAFVGLFRSVPHSSGADSHRIQMVYPSWEQYQENSLTPFKHQPNAATIPVHRGNVLVALIPHQPAWPADLVHLNRSLERASRSQRLFRQWAGSLGQLIPNGQASIVVARIAKVTGLRGEEVPHRVMRSQRAYAQAPRFPLLFDDSANASSSSSSSSPSSSSASPSQSPYSPASAFDDAEASGSPSAFPSAPSPYSPSSAFEEEDPAKDDEDLVGKTLEEVDDGFARRTHSFIDLTAVFSTVEDGSDGEQPMDLDDEATLDNFKDDFAEKRHAVVNIEGLLAAQPAPQVPRRPAVSFKIAPRRPLMPAYRPAAAQAPAPQPVVVEELAVEEPPVKRRRRDQMIAK